MRSPDPVFQQKAWLGWVAIAVVSLVGAGNFVIARYGIKDSINANDMTALRFGIAGLLLLPLLWRQGIRDLAGIGWRRAIILTSLAGAPFSLIMLWGLNFSPAAHGAVLIPGSIPIYTAIGLRIISGVRISPAKQLAFATIIGGLILVTGVSGTGTLRTLFGDLLFIVAGAAWSTYTILLRRWELDALRVTSVVSVLSLFYLPVYFAFIVPAVNDASTANFIFIGIYQGILLSIISLILYSVSVRHIGPQRTALGNTTVPVVTALLAVPVLGELPTLIQWVGIACVAAGVIAAARMQDVIPVTETKLPA